MKYFISLLTLLVLSCTKSSISPESIAVVDYCPLVVGNWIDYSVSVVVTDAKTKLYDTTTYLLREEVDRLIDTLGGESKYRLVRSVRANAQSVWQDLDAILVIKTARSVIRQENNTPVLSLSVPLFRAKKWNGNAYNTLDAVRFSVKSINIADAQYPLFDSVLTVMHAESESLIDYQFVSEKYAFNLGLIEQTNIDAYSGTLSVDASGQPVPVLMRADKSSIFNKKYISHGHR